MHREVVWIFVNKKEEMMMEWESEKKEERRAEGGESKAYILVLGIR